MPNYYAIRTRPTRPAMMVEGLNERERESFVRHSAWLKERTAAGVFIFVGRTRDAGTDGWALAVIKADSDEDARRIMNDDPFVRDGVVTPELVGFDIIAVEPENR